LPLFVFGVTTTLLFSSRLARVASFRIWAVYDCSAGGGSLVRSIPAPCVLFLMTSLHQESNTANSNERERRPERRAILRDAATGVSCESKITRGRARNEVSATDVSTTAQMTDHHKSSSNGQPEQHHRRIDSSSSSDDLHFEHFETRTQFGNWYGSSVD
jgi:hypothetical protein